MRKTQRLFSIVAFGLATPLLTACGDDDDDGGRAGSTGADTCDTCVGAQVCVSNLGGAQESSRCAALPPACGQAASCADSACIRELYGLCETGWLGVGCSDTFPPVIVSCNPG